MLGFPRLPRESWPVVFEVLAEFAATHDEFTLADCTKWARDRMVERGHKVGRQAITHVVRGTTFGGLDLGDRPSAAQIGEAVLAGSVVGRADDLGFELSDDDVAEVRAWLGLDGLGGDEKGAGSP